MTVSLNQITNGDAARKILPSVLADDFTRVGNRKKHSERGGRERRKAKALIEHLASFNLCGITTVEHIQQYDRDAEEIGSADNPHQTIEQQVSAIALPLITLADSDHRYERRRNIAVRRTVACIARRQISIADRMHVYRVETDQLPVGRHKHRDADIVSLGKLVGGLPEKIIDLLDTSRKAVPIMLFGIERLEARMRFPFPDHCLEYRS